MVLRTVTDEAVLFFFRCEGGGGWWVMGVG